jgi:hypothetical protein
MATFVKRTLNAVKVINTNPDSSSEESGNDDEEEIKVDS